VFEDQTGPQIDFDLRGSPDGRVELLGGHPHFTRSVPEEEASRALERRDGERLAGLMAGWPPDIRSYVTRLADRAAQLERAAARGGATGLARPQARREVK
jgi:hypothetical protein